MKMTDLWNKIKIAFFSQKKYQNYLRQCGVSIGKDCNIYKNVRFGTEPYLIRIGNHVRLTDRVEFITHDGAMWVLRYMKNDDRMDLIKPIEIKDNVFVGWGG